VLAQRRAREPSLLDEPLAKRSHQLCVGLGRACRLLGSSRGWRLRQRRHPSFDGGFADLMDQQEMTLGLHIRLEIPQGRLMPFQGFPTMSDAAMGLQILLNGSFKRQALILLRSGFRRSCSR